jgi:DNA repair exonuclease SbcCD ATPase subunit
LWVFSHRLQGCGGKCKCGGKFQESAAKASWGKGGGGGGSKGHWQGGAKGSAWYEPEVDVAAEFFGKLAALAADKPEVQAAMELLRGVYPSKGEDIKPRWNEASQAHTAAQKAVVKAKAAVCSRADNIKRLEEKLEAEKEALSQANKDLEEAAGKAGETARIIKELTSVQLDKAASSDCELQQAEDKSNDEILEAAVSERDALRSRLLAVETVIGEKQNSQAEASSRNGTRAAEQTATGAVKRIRADGGVVLMEDDKAGGGEVKVVEQQG